MRACKELGNTVYLITSKKLETQPWPWESIDEVFYMDEIAPEVWNLDDLVKGVAFLLRSNKINRIVALDDFDVEKAALLRENFRIPGMGQTTHRYFRDKLAMRQQAKDCNIPIPAFSAIFNDEEVNEYASKVPGPWLVKPRSEASALGIKKAHSLQELWEIIHQLGDFRHNYLVEKFSPGDVYHVDSIIYKGKVIFSCASKYLQPPLDITHSGGVFRTQTLNPNSNEAKKLNQLNEKVMQSFGMLHGVSHTEFIKDKETGEFLFLETSARVGGAHIHELVEAARGINLWKEWAKMENCLFNNEEYSLPKVQSNSAGIVISLHKDYTPDFSPFEQEGVKQIHVAKPHHIGILVQKKSDDEVLNLLNQFTDIIVEKYLSVLPPSDKPTS